MPLEGELRLYGIMRSMFRSMIETVEPDQMFELPAGGGNSPGWIVGHLTMANRFGVALLGGPGIDEGLLKHFGPGSASEVPQDQQFGKSALMAQEQASADALLAAIRSASPAVLNQPQKSGILENAFPTVENMLSHLLASHLSLHVGQLSAWRRSQGLPSILKI